MNSFPLNSIKFVTFLIAICILCQNCRNNHQSDAKLNEEMPRKILWAWERAEDLRFIDTDEFGAGFLAQTLRLENNEVILNPRRQPLKVSPETYLIAVTRIQTGKSGNNRPTLSVEQEKKAVSFIKKTIKLNNVKAIQIDFDVVVSERDFYRNLIKDLKKELPENMPLTMTSLASWCVGDAWFNDFPVDEAVPMAFVMGADDSRIRSFLADGNDWREPLCRGSYGISIDEPLKGSFKPNRRFFFFKSRSWEKSDLETLMKF